MLRVICATQLDKCQVSVTSIVGMGHGLTYKSIIAGRTCRLSLAVASYSSIVINEKAAIAKNIAKNKRKLNLNIQFKSRLFTE